MGPSDAFHGRHQAYKELQEELKVEMVKTEQEIEKLKDRVAHERVVRKNKEEYAALAKQVEVLAPRRSQTRPSLSREEEEGVDTAFIALFGVRQTVRGASV